MTQIQLFHKKLDEVSRQLESINHSVNENTKKIDRILKFKSNKRKEEIVGDETHRNYKGLVKERKALSPNRLQSQR